MLAVATSGKKRSKRKKGVGAKRKHHAQSQEMTSYARLTPDRSRELVELQMAKLRAAAGKSAPLIGENESTMSVGLPAKNSKITAQLQMISARSNYEFGYEAADDEAVRKLNKSLAAKKATAEPVAEFWKDADDDAQLDMSSEDSEEGQEAATLKKSSKNGGGGAGGGKKKKQRSTPSAAQNGEEEVGGSGAATTTPTKSRRSTGSKKMSGVQKEAHDEQTARKKARSADDSIKARWEAAMADYVSIALTSVWTERGAERFSFFDRVLRAEPSQMGEETERLKQSLSLIQTELTVALATLERAHPDEAQVMIDFVTRAKSIMAVESANIGTSVDATRCGVLRRPFPPDQITVIQRSGNGARLAVHKRLKPLFDALLFVCNLKKIAQTHILDRLATLSGTRARMMQSTHDAQQTLVATDPTKRASRDFLLSALRRHLDKIDGSVKLIYDLHHQPAEGVGSAAAAAAAAEAD